VAGYTPGLESVPLKKCGACHDNIFVGETKRGIRIALDVDVPNKLGRYYVDRIESGVMIIAQVGAPHYLFGKMRVQPHVLTCSARRHE
jgi:hypothetical protein